MSSPTIPSPAPEQVYTPAPIYQEPVRMSGFIDMKAPAVIPPDERINSSSVPHPQAHFDKPVTYHTDDLNSVSFFLIVHL